MSEAIATTKNRLKSWALWMSIAALAILVVKQFVGVDISETVDTVMNAALPVLVGFGIINNPTAKGKI
jgi:uncharacterized membrane protein